MFGMDQEKNQGNSSLQTIGQYEQELMVGWTSILKQMR